MSDESGKSTLTSVLETIAKFLTPVVIFGVGTYYTWTQDRIEMDQKSLDRCINISKDLSSNSEVQKELSIALLTDQCGKYETLRTFAVSRLIQTAAQSNSASVVASAKKAALALSANTNVANSVEQAVKDLPPRIYVQVPDDTKRGEVADLSKRLNLNVVPGQPSYSIEGVENVGQTRSPSTTQVRYFRTEDAGLAKSIADQLTKLGVADVKPMLSAGKAIPFQLEIWFARAPIKQLELRSVVVPTPTP